jgi:uroporphyrinogen-III synthase
LLNLQKQPDVVKIKSILISQPQPADIEKSPYGELILKHNVKVDFRKFFAVVSLSSAEFRQSRINLTEFTGIIFTSRNAVDSYFSLAKELRVEISENMKYFCTSDQIAFYLQKYIQFRKRKIFYGDSSYPSLLPLLKKHKDEKLVLPCNDTPNEELYNLLTENNVNLEKAVIYKNESANLKDLDLMSYDLLAFFSPHGIQSLMNNFPNYSQGEQIIAVYGKTTSQAAETAKLRVDVAAPTLTAPSMIMAIDEFIRASKKKK